LTAPLAYAGAVARALAVLLIGLLTAAGADAAGGAQRPGADPRNLILRLADLGQGYGIGDDSSCGLPLSDEGAPRSLARLERRYRQRSCGNEFERLWVAPGAAAGPPGVESSAFLFQRELGARKAFKLRRSLVAFSLGLRRSSLKRIGLSKPTGNAADAYETHDALVDGLPGRPGVVIFWRTGRLISLVFVAGRAATTGQQEALRLAQIQESRIERPTALQPGENDDLEVPLDNPGLGVEAQWLGRHFRPGGGLAPLVLRDSVAPIGPHEGPGWHAELDYASRSATGVMLGLWKPRAWARFRRTRLGRLVWHQRCARADRFGVEGGRAVIYSGYSRRQKHCGRRRPDRLLAHVYLRGLVVSVNIPICFACVKPERRPDPYNSRAGLRAVVRGLHPRPPAPVANTAP
jgi:hypothetical protein